MFSGVLAKLKAHSRLIFLLIFEFLYDNFSTLRVRTLHTIYLQEVWNIWYEYIPTNAHWESNGYYHNEVSLKSFCHSTSHSFQLPPRLEWIDSSYIFSPEFQVTLRGLGFKSITPILLQTHIIKFRIWIFQSLSNSGPLAAIKIKIGRIGSRPNSLPSPPLPRFPVSTIPAFSAIRIPFLIHRILQINLFSEPIPFLCHFPSFVRLDAVHNPFGKKPRWWHPIRLIEQLGSVLFGPQIEPIRSLKAVSQYLQLLVGTHR